MNITVYTVPGCDKTRRTYEELDQLGIAYETIDITKDPASRKHVIKTLGHRLTPIVVTQDDWSGFRPERLEALR